MAQDIEFLLELLESVVLIAKAHPETLGTALVSTIVERRDHIGCCDARQDRLVKAVEQV